MSQDLWVGVEQECCRAQRSDVGSQAVRRGGQEKLQDCGVLVGRSTDVLPVSWNLTKVLAQNWS